MAEKETIARPYAEAVFKRALETDTLDQWSQIFQFLGSVAADPYVSALVANPGVDRAKLAGLLLDICTGQLTDEGLNFVRLLAENHRLAVLPEIAEIYENLKLEQQGSIDVLLTSAYAVNATQQRKLTSVLEKRLGRQVKLTTQKDPSLIGGFVVRAGDLVIDGSVRERLKQMAASLSS
jgi:F-type H+-transporting ATPase subunit delta